MISAIFVLVCLWLEGFEIHTTLNIDCLLGAIAIEALIEVVFVMIIAAIKRRM